MTAKGTNTSRRLRAFSALNHRRSHDASRLTAHAFLTRTDLEQVFEGVDPGVVAVGPVDAEGVGAHQGNTPGADVFGNVGGIEDGATCHLFLALRAPAPEAEKPGG